ncbi:MAG: M50 family metallopeptidase [Anaerohalosphaeraceae bacterium]
MEEERAGHRILKAGFLLLAALFAATNLAKFLHEIGHALGAWSTGGTVHGVVIHPFSWSYAIIVSPRNDITTWAGSVLGSLFGILITLSVFKWRSGRLLIPLLVGPVACLCNGSYLVLGSVFHLAGDGSILAARYAPAGAVAAVGLLMLCAGMLLAVLIIPELGFGAADGIVHRTAVLAIGILPYELVILGVQYFGHRQGLRFWLFSAAAACIGLLVFAGLSFWLQQRLSGLRNRPPARISRRAVLAHQGIAVFLLAVLLIQLGYKEEILFSFQMKRPEGFPEELVPPDWAEEASYGAASSACLLSYRYTEQDHPFEQVQGFIHTHLQNHGYQKLRYHLSDPNQILSDEWICRPLQGKEEKETFPSVQVCKFSEQWLKLDDLSPRCIRVEFTKLIDPEETESPEVIVILTYYEVLWPVIRDYLKECEELYGEEDRRSGNQEGLKKN